MAGIDEAAEAVISRRQAFRVGAGNAGQPNTAASKTGQCAAL